MAEPLRKPARNLPGTPLPVTFAPPRIPLVTFGLSLGLFLVITYVLCVGFDLLLPAQAMHPNWEHLLPGFTWLTWPSFVIGLVESFAYAWYVALIFCPLFNFFAARSN
ncbi:MAG TPA: DUF5676 family membrane protein [Stellaceae bacterium]|nr:DUF5676 family membrane protein [Stellaceae bacterium]